MKQALTFIHQYEISTNNYFNHLILLLITRLVLELQLAAPFFFYLSPSLSQEQHTHTHFTKRILALPLLPVRTQVLHLFSLSTHSSNNLIYKSLNRPNLDAHLPTNTTSHAHVLHFLESLHHAVNPSILVLSHAHMHSPGTTDSTCRHACVQNIKINANNAPPNLDMLNRNQSFMRHLR
jgi:hypothetical protein